MYPIIQGDIPVNSIDKDMHYEHIGGMGVKKYLRENCYHRIECSIANSLTALMRKWYLNSTFQPYSYPQRLQEGYLWDKDQHKQSTVHMESRDEKEEIV